MLLFFVFLQSHYEFNIHVPTIVSCLFTCLYSRFEYICILYVQDQRTEACTQSGFGADGQYEGLGKLYTALEQVHNRNNAKCM